MLIKLMIKFLDESCMLIQILLYFEGYGTQNFSNLHAERSWVVALASLDYSLCN